MASRFVDEIARECLRTVGLQENPIGSNRGNNLTWRLSKTTWLAGDPWCLSLAQAIVLDVYEKQGAALPKYLLPLSASCTEYRKQVQRVAPEKVIYGLASAGSLFMLLDNSSPRDEYHAGICLGVCDWKPGFMVTFEGNTNSRGGSEGFEAIVRTRPIKDTLIIVH